MRHPRESGDHVKISLLDPGYPAKSYSGMTIFMKTVIFILGPTSSGKSRVAAGLAGKIGGEVISCDSMQIYKDMDVITRSPGKELLTTARHHLIGIIPPEEEFNAAMFTAKAEKVIKAVIDKGKTPIVAGGTGLYVKALVDGIFESPFKDETLREEFKRRIKEQGAGCLHERLRKIDPETAAKLHPNDEKRIIRALEVYHLTGRTISEKKTESLGSLQGYKYVMFGLDVPRKMLYERINTNIEKMFKEGLVKAVEELSDKNISITASKALGIKEVKMFLKNKISLEETKEELKKNTRRYAKRQLTWFRGDKRIVWVNADRETGEVVEDIENSVLET